MKKIFALMMVLVLTMGLAACSKEEKKPEETAKNVTEAAKEAEAAATDAPKATEAPTDAPAEEEKAPVENAETAENTNTAETPADETTVVTEPDSEIGVGENTEGLIGFANPMVQYDSLEELNDTYYAFLVKPPVMGVTNEAFYGIEGDLEYPIAQYTFDLNGIDYMFRYSGDIRSDISGIYHGDGMLFDNAEANDAGEEIVFTDELKAARWITVDGQYVLAAYDNGVYDAETFGMIVSELHGLTVAIYDMSDETLDNDETEGDAEADYYSAIAGQYQDSYGKRASAVVEDCGSYANITVNWASSADENTKWTMNLYYEDGVYSYTDGIKMNVVGDEGTVVYEDAVGFFELVDGVLCWTGAPEEDCVNCTFEKMDK